MHHHHPTTSSISIITLSQRSPARKIAWTWAFPLVVGPAHPVGPLSQGINSMSNCRVQWLKHACFAHTTCNAFTIFKMSSKVCAKLWQTCAWHVWLLLQNVFMFQSQPAGPHKWAGIYTANFSLDQKGFQSSQLHRK